MQITISKKGKVRIKAGKFKFQNKISLGDLITIIVDLLILIAIYHVS